MLYVHFVSVARYANTRINPFPHNDTFWQVWERSCLKTLWEKEKLLVQAISPFPTMFSTLSKTEVIIFVIFDLSSANAFSLVWSKILLCGNELSLVLSSAFMKYFAYLECKVRSARKYIQSGPALHPPTFSY